MSNIGTSVALSKMGLKPTAVQFLKAQASAKKKIGDLSFKPSDSQKKSILMNALRNVINEDEGKKPASAPAPAPAPKPTMNAAQNIVSGMIKTLKSLPRDEEGDYMFAHNAIAEYVTDPFIHQLGLLDYARNTIKLGKESDTDNPYHQTDLTSEHLAKKYKPTIDYLEGLLKTKIPVSGLDKSYTPKSVRIKKYETDKKTEEAERYGYKAEAPKAAPAPAPKAAPAKASGVKYYIEDGEGKEGDRAYTLNDKGRLAFYAVKFSKTMIEKNKHMSEEVPDVWHTVNPGTTKEALVEGDSVYKVIHKKKGAAKDKKLLKTVTKLE
jgi:hypothetical protein